VVEEIQKLRLGHKLNPELVKELHDLASKNPGRTGGSFWPDIP
jgi:hypothetical protein